MSRGGDGAVKHGRFGTFADAIGVDLVALIRELKMTSRKLDLWGLWRSTSCQ
jgi:hypothetical protein